VVKNWPAKHNIATMAKVTNRFRFIGLSFVQRDDASSPEVGGSTTLPRYFWDIFPISSQVVDFWWIMLEQHLHGAIQAEHR
jgi:hypothetical protein